MSDTTGTTGTAGILLDTTVMETRQKYGTSGTSGTSLSVANHVLAIVHSMLPILIFEACGHYETSNPLNGFILSLVNAV